MVRLPPVRSDRRRVDLQHFLERMPYELFMPDVT